MKMILSKETLLKAYEISEPDEGKKREFLRQYQATAAQKAQRKIPPRISTARFLLVQSRYIRPQSFALSALVFLLSLILITASEFGVSNSLSPAYETARTLAAVSAILPFAAVGILLEIYRSEAHQMDELERTTRFSLRNVLLSRLTVLGGCQVGLFLLLLPLLNHFLPSAFSHGIFRAAIYLSVPYLACSLIGLTLSRRLRGQAGAYAGAAFSFLTAAGFLLKFDRLYFLYETAKFGLWGVAFAALFIGVLRQYKCRVSLAMEW